LKVAFGSNFVPSGTVTSATNWAWKHAAAEAPVGIAAAGTSDSTMANNKTIEVNFNRDFMGFSSVPSN
jgi:hypothetical protein